MAEKKGKNALNFGEMEKKWRDYWAKNKIYGFNAKSGKKIYSIDTPPPTVSGEMHMGHAFSYSQEDFIARYKRMQGFEVLYPFGTDDNGLPTERLIERLKKVKSKEMSRSDFIKLCLKTLEEIRPGFVQDWKNLGVSCDYDVFYSTIDEHSQKISQKSFVELYRKGLVYEGKSPTIYCPECQTPVAQAELEDRNLPSHFSTLKFESDGEVLPIATTRPELLGACVCVFVNPKDKRYKRLVGKKARVPLFGHEVPILEDEGADMEKGTGILMVCSYGDKYDVDAISRRKLEPRVIFDSDGTIKDGMYKGLAVKDARKKILADLKSEGLILEQKQIEHVVNVHDKCGTEIEFLPVKQWFIKILDRKKELVRQGKKITWKPAFMFKRYENWVKGLEWDWSISRDRHFGIPIPVWYCKKCGKHRAAEVDELPVDPVEVSRKCEKCGEKMKPETKVLDTWATSSMTPQIVSDLLDGTVKIPYSLRPQAHDIIRTWAFYTIVKSLLHEGKIPWDEITVSGFTMLGGEKMSKSKGNVVRPQDSMETFGSDSLRYWAASSKLGDDVEYQEQDLVAGKKFVTKILNASKFVFMNLEGFDGEKPRKMCEVDRLFLSLLDDLAKEVTKEFDNYEYARVKLAVEKFFWQAFTDNYLELVKWRVYNGNEEEKRSAHYALYHGLQILVKLFAPFTPFVCEEIYQTWFKDKSGTKSVHLCAWPEKVGVAKQKHDVTLWGKMVDVIGKVRAAKSEAKVSMKAEVILSLPSADLKELKDVMDDLKAVCGAREIKEGKFDVVIL